MKRWIWITHRWTGFALLIPLLWWMGTSVVMSLWAIEHVRGNTYVSGHLSEPRPLPADAAISAETIAGALSVRALTVEEHPLLVIERPPAHDAEGEEHAVPSPPEIRYLRTGTVIGGAIPAEWAVAAALRDFREPAQAAAVWLYTRNETGTQVLPAPDGHPEQQSLPREYTGPLPAYAVHLDHKSGMHLYVDGVTGQIRARRTSVWRFYDFCFQLHALEFVPDSLKRAIMLPLLALWFLIGATGFYMWWRLVIAPRRKATSRP